MNAKQSLLAMTGGTALLVALAWWSTRDTDQTPPEAGPLCPKLENSQPATIAITPANGKPWQAQLKDGTWTLDTLDGYPADAKALKSFVYRLSTAKGDVAKTALAANYPQLGLADPGSKENAGTRVEIKDAKGAVLADVLFGHFAATGGQFVRRQGEAQSWLSKDAPNPPGEAVIWVDRQIANLPATTFQSVTLTLPPVKPITLETPPPATANDKDAAAKKKLADYPWQADAARRIFNGLGWARFDAVKRDDPKNAPQGLPVTLRFVPPDPAQHETIEAELWPAGTDQAWVRLRAVAPPMPVEEPDNPLLAGIKDAKKAAKKQLNIPPGIAAAKAKNTAWSGWLFKIGGDLGFASRQTPMTLAKEKPAEKKEAKK